MKLSGLVKINFHHKETGIKTREPIIQKNLIFDETYLHMLGFKPQILFSSNPSNPCVITLLDDNTPPIANDSTWTELAFGEVPTGIISPKWYESVYPYFGEIQNSVPAPTLPLTFNSVGLADTNRTRHFCRTLLSIPCTQQPFEILSIFYQIQIINTVGDYLPSDRFIRDLGGSLFDIKNCNIYVLGTSFSNQPIQPYIDILQPNNLIENNSLGTPTINFWSNSMRVDSHYKFKYNKNWKIQNSGNVGDTDEQIGQIFNTLCYGYSNNFISATQFIQNTQYIEDVGSCYKTTKYDPKILNINPIVPVYSPPFQKIWTHRENAPKPFFDENNIAIGTGKITTAGTWTGKLPELYKVKITTTGETGTATYKLYVRKHLGFEGNAYIDKMQPCIFRNNKTPSALGMHGYRIENNDLIGISDTKIVQYDSTGITILDVFNGEYKNFDSSTTPQLPTTAIRQVAVDKSNTLIYVACRNTGLWVINYTSNTVSHPITSSCYGVDIGLSSVAFAVSTFGLSNSTSWSTIIPTDIVLFGNSYNNCYFLKVDPVNNNVAFVVSYSNIKKILWFNGTNTIDGYIGADIGLFSTYLDVSESNSFWASYDGFKLDFGTATRTSLGSDTPRFNINHSIWGNISLGKTSFYNNYLICNDKLVDIFGNTENTYTNISYGNINAVNHVIDGICITNEGLRQLFTDNVYCWLEYGFNGTNWILNHASSRTTHSTFENLINGLTIKFENGLSTPSFFLNDFYTQGLNYGILKDNATTIYIESAWYSHPVYESTVPLGTIIPSGLIYTVPESLLPDFLRLEDDTLAVHKLLINGTPVQAIYNNATPPAPQEINMNAVNGTILFNSADIGKLFEGTYFWIGI